MITLPGCLWCKRPFRARRGGSPKRFCCAAHRIAFWSAARRWAERAVVDADRCQFADCLRHLADHVLQQWLGHAIREGHIELAGDERQYRRRQVADDRIFDAVEIRSALLPIIGVSGHLDVLVRLEPDEFKRARADRMLAHVSRRDMTGIDRGIPGSEQSEKGWLRPLQAEGNLIVAMRGDRVEVPVPGLARIDAQLLARLADQHLPATLDVLGCEELAVVPSDTLTQRKGQLGSVLAPRPASSEIRNDRIETVLFDVLIEHHEIIEDTHHRPL